MGAVSVLNQELDASFCSLKQVTDRSLYAFHRSASVSASRALSACRRIVHAPSYMLHGTAR